MRKTKKLKKGVSNKGRIIVPILGIFVDSTSKTRALNRAWEMGDEGYKGDRGNMGKRPKLIVTPNPEIILSGYKDESQARILNKADLAVPDGVGVVIAMRYLGMRDIGEMGGMREMRGILMAVGLAVRGLWVGLSLFFNRKWLFEISEVVPGRWLFEELVKRAAKEGKRVFLLGGKAGVATRAAQNQKSKIKNQNYNLKFKVLAATGPWLDQDGRPQDEEQEKIEKEVIKQINTFKPNFLFVGFGHPKQEKWLARNLPKLRVGVAMTVGGVFDYLAGGVPVPPQWMTRVGFEWFWRLITQPVRIRRIFDAVVVFPLKIYFYKLNNSRIQ